MNKRVTPRERGLLKGAIRRVFSRSDLRKEAIEAARADYSDPTRPRVKKWSVCSVCLQFTPTYLMQVDHKNPIIPVNSSLEEMLWDDVVNRTWCDPKDLTPMCKPCHTVKTKEENATRRKNKKERKR